MNMRVVTQVSQRGSVLIVTLWTITLMTILITALAGQVRLSARVALFHQEELDTWSKTLAAINQAEMEVMLELMDKPPGYVEDPNLLNRNRLYRFNGQELQLAYPQAEGITVRIYDHGGKINLRELSRARLRGMLRR